MNNAARAVRFAHNIATELTALDCKILNKVAALIIKYGAISAERVATLTKFSSITVGWALFQLEAVETSMQLFILPG